jgi:MerR family transcriptional regulator, light-induced transcriptional regulator
VSAPLSIRDVAEQTGIGQATLRMWESRYGFPEPTRLPSGHRRFSDKDVELVRQVARDRDAGMSLKAAIARARSASVEPETSIFAGLRRRRPDLAPHVLPKRTLIALSHAIEDECCARAERPLLFASFQRERFYRDSEARWRELARTAELAVAMADFGERRDPSGGPSELPIDSSNPLAREWSLVCDAPEYSACLAAWEIPGQDGDPDLDRRLETIWTVEPELVREAARIAIGLIAAGAPDLVEGVRERLAETPPPSADEMRLVSTLTNRMVAYVGGAEISSLPAPHASGSG